MSSPKFGMCWYTGVRRSTTSDNTTTAPNSTIAIYKDHNNMKNFQLTDPLYQTLIGFENLISRATNTTSYPPYNLFKDGESYVLEIAVAGWDRSELSVEFTGTTLTVSGTKEPTETREYLHRGLAHRSWTRTWTPEPDIRVSDVTLLNGVLWVTLIQKTTSTTQKIEIN